jgi:hypothetical protein
MNELLKKGETKPYIEIEKMKWNSYTEICQAKVRTILETNMCSINNKECKMETCFLKIAARDIRNYEL